MKKEEKEEKFFTERDKTLFSIFLFIFALSVLFLNWTNFSWFLNIQTGPIIVKERLSGIFSFEREEKREEEKEGLEEKEEIVEKIPEEEIIEEEIIYCDEDRIFIFALDVDVSIVETTGTTEAEYREALDRGVVHFPGSSYPGEEGLTVLLGHSAPVDRPRIKHDWVFSELNKLREGDEIEVCFNNRFFVYTVIEDVDEKNIYEVGEDVAPLYSDDKGKREMVLMSCWPPGSDTQRIGVRAIIE